MTGEMAGAIARTPTIMPFPSRHIYPDSVKRRRDLTKIYD